MVLACWFVWAAPACKDDEGLATQDLLLYSFLIASNTFTYRSSCNTPNGSAGLCINYYVNPISTVTACRNYCSLLGGEFDANYTGQ